ncbi:unnamed protein product, partial [marine sediment metagenome]
DHWNDEEFAKSDGFTDIEEFRDMWFPEWREAPVLDDVVEAYELLKKEEYTVDEIIMHSGRALGKNTLMEFLQLEYMMIQWKLVEKGMMTEAKYGYHKTRLDEDTIEDINQLNFENWIHQNEGIFKFIYDEYYEGRYPHEVTEFFKDGDHGRAWLTKLLKRGVQFGVISNGRIVADSGRPRLYRATKAGVVYYEKMLKERIESSLS